MKMLSIACLVLGLCALGVGLYCQLEVVPSLERVNRLSLDMDMDNPLYKITRIRFMELSDKKMTYGTIAMVAGGLGLLGGFFTGIKKVKLGFIAAAVSLPGLILGLLQASHMFS